MSRETPESLARRKFYKKVSQTESATCTSMPHGSIWLRTRSYISGAFQLKKRILSLALTVSTQIASGQTIPGARQLTSNLQSDVKTALAIQMGDRFCGFRINTEDAYNQLVPTLLPLQDLVLAAREVWVNESSTLFIVKVGVIVKDETFFISYNPQAGEKIYHLEIKADARYARVLSVDAVRPSRLIGKKVRNQGSLLNPKIVRTPSYSREVREKCF